MSNGMVMTLVQETARLSLPYGFAALGGLIAERSGLPHIALEAALVLGAWATTFAFLQTGGMFASVLAAMFGGLCVGGLLSYSVLKLRVDPILSGIAINVAALGGARVLLRACYGSTSNSPTLSLEAGSWRAWVLLGVLLLLTLGVQWAFAHTRLGLQIRAIGEDEARAQVVGVPVVRVRAIAALAGSAIAALGGFALVIDERQFQSQMTGGRGFVALSAVMLGRKKPVHAFAACVFFGAVEALSVVLQARSKLPAELLHALPYVLTLVALGVTQRLRLGRAAPLATFPKAG
jgi:general nucleoside transport system permease protein